MGCIYCNNNPVYIDISGKKFCGNHFIRLYEKKIIRTINKFKLINKNDKIIVAVSGGKDSMALFYFLSNYCKERNIDIQALTIDEGIKEENKKISYIKKYAKDFGVRLNITSYKDEFGFSLDDIAKLIKEKKINYTTCYVCGVLRRWLINKYAFKLGATKLATGHCLNDEAQTVIINFLKGNASLLARGGVLSGIKTRKKFVQRIKPLYFCSEKENNIYCSLKKMNIITGKCKYINSYRLNVRNFLNDFEEKHRGTYYAIINTYLEILPLLKTKYKDESEELNYCSICDFPSSGEICSACKLINEIKKYIK
ncbi:MAG: TIGR00269 family protein [Candidatus Pacearchaeota archaeon]